MLRKQIIFFLLIFSQILNAQTFDTKDTIFNSGAEFKAINSLNWSCNSQKLVFSASSDSADQFDIFVFNISDGSLQNVSSSSINELNPVWHPDGMRVIFDKVVDSTSRLYVFDPQNSFDSPLFSRNIQSRQASFSLDTMLVSFSGFDIIEDKWQIYTYDFVYDNLNQLTKAEFNVQNPIFSPDGKHILYEETDSTSKSFLKMINWYGKPELLIDTIEAYNAFWDYDSWRFNFLSKTTKGEDLISLRYNGQSPIRLITKQLSVKEVALSPDKLKFAIIFRAAKYDYLIIGSLN